MGKNFISQSLREFEEIYNQTAGTITGFNQAIGFYNRVPWGPHQVDEETRQEFDNMMKLIETRIGTIIPKLDSIRQQFMTLKAGCKDKTIKKRDANLELCLIFQEAMLQYNELMGFAASLQGAVMGKQTSHQIKQEQTGENDHE